MYTLDRLGSLVVSIYSCSLSKGAMDGGNVEYETRERAASRLVRGAATVSVHPRHPVPDGAYFRGGPLAHARA